MSNSEFKSRIHEKKWHHSGWSKQSFSKKLCTYTGTTVGCHAKLRFQSGYLLNIHDSDNKCL